MKMAQPHAKQITDIFLSSPVEWLKLARAIQKVSASHPYRWTMAGDE